MYVRDDLGNDRSTVCYRLHEGRKLHGFVFVEFFLYYFMRNISLSRIVELGFGHRLNGTREASDILAESVQVAQIR